ncbi:unnamed protein product [Absidia cylindrospora]
MLASTDMGDNDYEDDGEVDDMGVDVDTVEDDFDLEYGDGDDAPGKIRHHHSEDDNGGDKSGSTPPIPTKNITTILPVAGPSPPGTSDSPFLFTLLDPDVLAENKEHIHDFDRGMQHALWYLKKSANRFVMDKDILSVVNAFKSGVDTHNYVSLARYFWPDHTSPNGLPYVRIDGQVNPEIHTAPDYKAFRQMVSIVLDSLIIFGGGH